MKVKPITKAQRQALFREIGAAGGKAAARHMTADERRERAKQGGLARQAKWRAAQKPTAKEKKR